jgi:hypothetical protein
MLHVVVARGVRDVSWKEGWNVVLVQRDVDHPDYDQGEPDNRRERR